ncbi:MAG: hypothetical protein JJU00_08900 [Opitutales bacterium]|nr:hypothetical protein [Opitutales bacterium]
MGRSVLRIAVALIAGYLLVVLVLAGCQRGMVYYPMNMPEDRLRAAAADEGMMPWEGPDGATAGWRTAAESPPEAPVFVVFHGNAGFALHRVYFVNGFNAAVDDGPPDVRIFEYPGYGARGGRPSEDAIKAAALDALDPLFAAADGPVFLVGESLGTGVASYVAGQRPEAVAGLLLVTPFTSLVDVGRAHYRFLPVGMLLRERFPSDEALRGYGGPVAFVVAEHDEVVPTELGVRLYEGYDGPKRIWKHAGAGHNTINYDPAAGWWGEVITFLLGSNEE